MNIFTLLHCPTIVELCPFRQNSSLLMKRFNTITYMDPIRIQKLLDYITWNVMFMAYEAHLKKQHFKSRILVEGTNFNNSAFVHYSVP